MSFKINIALFKNTKPDSKVDFGGSLKIKVEELDALCAWAMAQEMNQWGTVEIPISGWKKTSAKGTAYVSAVAEPPRPRVDEAAAQLAAATNGAVVDADMF
jgi:uncharacterized protein YfaP (DUF2135 family)